MIFYPYVLKSMVLYYAVRVGRKPGIYNTWNAAKGQVAGFSGAIFKKFPTIEQANQFLKENDEMPPENIKANHTSRISKVDIFSSHQINNSSNDPIIMYTDGCCLGNNFVYENLCPAGWGVVIVQNDQTGTLRISNELYGDVILDKDSPYYLGAIVGNQY
jgi:hypothetical protein